MNFDHLTIAEIASHIARLEASTSKPTGIAYTLADYGLECKELAALKAELEQR